MPDHQSRSAREQLLFLLSHPLRQKILKEVAGEAELSPRECSQRIKVHLGSVGYHFRVLAEYEAIALVRTEPTRGSMKHYYRFAIEEPWALEALGLAPPRGQKKT